VRPVTIVACACLLPSCHLAESIDAPKCEKGSHVELGRCTKDETTEKQIRIKAAAGGTSCSGDPAAQRPPVLDPESITVKVGEEFQFDNQDAVAHEIRGTEGTAWVTAPPGVGSPFASIKKAGTWAYRLSGCAKGGEVIVE
jgi:hypothetical protein